MRLTHAILDPVALAPTFAELCGVGDGVPSRVDGWFDAKGNPRRAKAHYANGWSIEVRLTADGKMSSWKAAFSAFIGGKPR